MQYDSIQDLGLTDTTATMDAIIQAMSAPSIAILPITQAWTAIDIPYNYGILTIIKQHASRVSCVFMSVESLGMWFGTVATAGQSPNAFAGWQPVATATPPQEYNLPLESGITGNVRYAKSQTGFVLITVDISGSYTNATLIGTLPVGYRPAETVTALARIGGLFATIDVTSNGSVRVYNVNGTVNNAAFSQIAYIAAD